MRLNREFFLPDHPCIYYLYDNNKIVYVGKTRRPSDRFMAHSRSDKIFDSIEIKECDKTVMSDLELAEIKIHQPIYNRVGK